jgi:allantoinase
MERGWRCGSIPIEFFGLDDVIDRIEAASGKQPVGWLGDGLAQTWNTLDYLAEAGIRYVCGWVNDDQPYLFDIGNPPLVSLPYSVQTNDVPGYFRDEGVGPRIRGDAAPPIRHALPRRRDGPSRHGDRRAPVCHRPAASDRRARCRLECICSHAGVWRATGWEIVQHFPAQQQNAA